jgi:N-acetylglucosamine kinase-like BadF-type ATPase
LNRPVLIGIDGGGSGTRAIVGHGPGEVLGVGAAGVACVRDVGEQAATTALLAAVADAWHAARSPARAADSIYVGLAGVATASDRGAAERMARSVGHRDGAPVTADHDLAIAHAGAFARAERRRRGVVLVAGTGAACMGVDALGTSALCGGWGPALGDGGGGYFLGIEAMRAVVRATDGRGPATELCARVRAALEIDEPRDMLRLVGRDGDRKRVAALAPNVIELAAAGEPLATEILDRGVGELASLIVHATARVATADGGGDVPYAVVGGLARAGAPLLDRLREEVRLRRAPARWVEPDRTPLEGALLLAAEACA